MNIEQLTNEYERLKENFEVGENDINLAQLYFMKQALQCMEFTKDLFAIDLDGSVDSLSLIDEIISELYRANQEDEIADEVVQMILSDISGYFALVALTNLGGVPLILDENYVVLDYDGNEIDPDSTIKSQYANNDPQVFQLYEFIKENK